MKSEQNRPRLVLDCDPGIDDAFAIFCALRYGDVAGLSTVAGNTSLDNTTANAARILDLAGSDLLVSRGADRPLAARAGKAEEVHGASGLGDDPPGDPSIKLSDESAVEMILRCTSEDPGLALVAVGPLTNLAHAIEADPTVVDRIGHLYWMGGSATSGNRTDKAEFNCWADPHAASIVFAAGIPISMYGLNLTRQVRFGSVEVAVLAEAATATATASARWLEYYARNASSPHGQPLHDACALLGLTHPASFATETCFATIHTDDDHRGWTETSQKPTRSNVPFTLVTSADSRRVIDLVLSAAINPSGS